MLGFECEEVVDEDTGEIDWDGFFLFNNNFEYIEEITDYIGSKMSPDGPKLLWGTANMFSHRRWMAGASTNPDPDVYAFAAATVKSCMDATHKLGGQNYVLWGCLLYTSPSPRDRTRSRMPSSA